MAGDLFWEHLLLFPTATSTPASQGTQPTAAGPFLSSLCRRLWAEVAEVHLHTQLVYLHSHLPPLQLSQLPQEVTVLRGNPCLPLVVAACARGGAGAPWAAPQLVVHVLPEAAASHLQGHPMSVRPAHTSTAKAAVLVPQLWGREVASSPSQWQLPPAGPGSFLSEGRVGQMGREENLLWAAKYQREGSPSSPAQESRKRRGQL